MSYANPDEGKPPHLPRTRIRENVIITSMPAPRQTPARQSTIRARELRKTQTPYEAKLWKLLSNRQLEGYKFRRQVPIGRYFADFCCVRAKLVVELDGNSHDDRQEYDALRDATMRNDGWRIIRIPNRDLMKDEEGVWLTIEAALKEE